MKPPELVEGPGRWPRTSVRERRVLERPHAEARAGLAVADRLLELAAEPALGLFERVRFAATAAEHLDGFFEVHAEARSVLRTELHDRLARLEARVEALLPELARVGVRLASWPALAPETRRRLSGRFEREIFPLLTPCVVGAAHPFPWVPGRVLNLGVGVRPARRGPVRFARVGLPARLPRFLPAGPPLERLALEALVEARLESLFPGMEIVFAGVFRVLRQEAHTEPGAARSRETAVRLELDRRLPAWARDLLRSNLGVAAEDVQMLQTLAAPAALRSLARIERHLAPLHARRA